MNPFRRLGTRLARIGYVKRAIAEHADLSAFAQRPSARLVVGVALIALSFVVGGAPTLALLGVLALHFGEPLIFVVGAPAAYAASWLVWGAGMIIAGKDNVMYMNAFLRWLTRVTVEGMIGRKKGGSGDE